jgi:cyclophilin family peptidyl-prolyl cis-trans isomerase
MNAVIGTSLGTIKIKLLPKIASLVVANFVELSEGTKELTDSKTGKAEIRLEQAQVVLGTSLKMK